MPTSFTINKLNYANSTSTVQNWKFEYKLWSATSYILISASEPVNIDGTLQASPPLVVTGLVAGQLYYLRASNNCESPAIYFIQSIQL